MLVMLQAIAKSGGDRAKATSGLFGLTITNGILGNFTINSSGDTNLTQITIYKQIGKVLKPVKTLVPDASIIG
jgi:ABC-type branched-subunit amino acid transport system substrate-binding protein